MDIELFSYPCKYRNVYILLLTCSLVYAVVVMTPRAFAGFALWTVSESLDQRDIPKTSSEPGVPYEGASSKYTGASSSLRPARVATDVNGFSAGTMSPFE